MYFFWQAYGLATAGGTGVLEVTGNPKYANNLHCAWLIQPGACAVLAITFEWVDTEEVCSVPLSRSLHRLHLLRGSFSRVLILWLMWMPFENLKWQIRERSTF